MTITFDFENKPEQPSMPHYASLADNKLQGYNEYIMTKFRLIPIDDEKLKNLVTISKKLPYTGELRTPAIRQSMGYFNTH
jgi:hypothetical protein